jgi:acylphosphatase
MTGSESPVRAHVLVSGRVQGVFFRDSTAKAARSRGVAGWIRNLPDGRVEAFFEGSRDAVESMISWCKTGPRHADVDDVSVEWEPAQGESGFRVR